jgi:hypothetical protein
MPVWSAIRMRDGGFLVVLWLMIEIVIESKRPTSNPPSQGYGVAAAQGPTPNLKQHVISSRSGDEGPHVRVVGHTNQRCASSRLRMTPAYPAAAMTFNSIAIGVGNAPTSIVVRVGFGLPSPEKYCA